MSVFLQVFFAIVALVVVLVLLGIDAKTFLALLLLAACIASPFVIVWGVIRRIRDAKTRP